MSGHNARASPIIDSNSISYQNMRKFQKVAARVNEIEEQVNQKLIATYMPGISKRQKQFLEKIAFSSGKNHYIQLPMPLAKTPDIADDLIQTQDSDCATSESLLCQEINDQDVESLLSLAGNKDQLRLLYVYRAY